MQPIYIKIEMYLNVVQYMFGPMQINLEVIKSFMKEIRQCESTVRRKQFYIHFVKPDTIFCCMFRQYSCEW